MSEPNPEWLILAVALIALALAPVASRLVRQVGDQVSGEIDGGRSGDDLESHLDASYEGSMRDDEIAQMVAARDFVRSRRTGAVPDDAGAGPEIDEHDELREEVRQVVVAGNERRARMGEEPLDVEAETQRRLVKLLGRPG